MRARLKLAHDIAKALQTTIDDLSIFEDAQTISNIYGQAPDSAGLKVEA